MFCGFGKYILATDVFVCLHVKNMNNCKMLIDYVWSILKYTKITLKVNIFHEQCFLPYVSYNIATNLHFDAGNA